MKFEDIKLETTLCLALKDCVVRAYVLAKYREHNEVQVLVAYDIGLENELMIRKVHPSCLFSEHFNAINFIINEKRATIKTLTKEISLLTEL